MICPWVAFGPVRQPRSGTISPSSQAWKLTLQQRGGLTTWQFVRYGLLRLRLGQDLKGFRYGGPPRGLASEAKSWPASPELASRA